MKPAKAIQLLQDRKAEALELVDDTKVSIAPWHGRTDSVLLAIFGGRHRFYASFRAISFSGPRSWTDASPGMRDAMARQSQRMRFAGLTQAVLLIENAIFDLEISDGDDTVPGDAPSGIFLVHGHDEALKESAARTITQLTGFEPTILSEMPNRGQTIIEKFERHASGQAYAVVLATGDDCGGANGKEAKPRARQNVVFELGFFVAALGRDRVAVLLEAGVEEPSDYRGVAYIPVDKGRGWRQALHKEFQAAGIESDANKLK